MNTPSSSASMSASACLCSQLSEMGILAAAAVSRDLALHMAQVPITAVRTRPRRRGQVRRPSALEPTRGRTGPGVGHNQASSPKHRLASQINRLLDEQQLSQLAAAERLGISQSKVSAIRNYKLHGISLGRLMEALVALDQRVTIVVSPRAPHPKEPISVVL